MNEHLRNEVIRRWLSGQSMRAIARELPVSRPTIRRVIAAYEAAREDGAPSRELPQPRCSRQTLLDPFAETISQFLARYPNITVTRLLEELRALGYQGGYTILRQWLQGVRGPATRRPVERFETGPGVQAQMDWAVYDIDFTQEGRRRVNLFSYLLGYSRRQHLRFTESQDFETTLREHIRAFHHLGGVAATCLYDNMKVVVTRWEDDEPIYNTRFLSFATHYGFRPWACRPRRPETKGKVERPFFYVETNLLNGRTFRSLEHLHEVTRWWLENVADVRVHRTTHKRPVDAHAEELPHLLPLPAHDYDTARVVYRVVAADGFITYRQNQYSAPWRYLGQVLPVRITEDELILYSPHVEQIVRHPLFPASQSGRQRLVPSHRPPRDVQQQVELLRERFAAFGEVATRFLDGLLLRHRSGKAQAHKVLALVRAYHRDDVLAALERAVCYQAFSLASLERILAVKAQPKSPWLSLAEELPEGLQQLRDCAIPPRPTADYQYLLFPKGDDDESKTNPNPQDDHPQEGPETHDAEHRDTPPGADAP